MNKVSKVFATFFALAVALMVGALVIGCKTSTEPSGSNGTEPAGMVANNSEATADMMATALGNESGGLGMALGDSYHIATTGTVGSTDSKGNSIASSNVSYDSTTGWHTLTVTKNITWGNSSIVTDFVYQYQFIDTANKFQRNWKKGLVDITNFKFTGIRDRERGQRLDIDDSASGTWSIKGLANFNTSPIFTGTYSRSGADTLLTQKNNQRSLNHSLTVIFSNDTLIRLLPNNDKYFFLDGTANSTYHATDGKGNVFDRSVAITYNGNGTATLDVTRTKDGITDTFTIDVVVGIFDRWGR